MPNGTLIADGEFFITPALSTGITSNHPSHDAAGLLDLLAISAGAKSPVNISIRSLPEVRSSHDVYSFFDDFYNRVYLIPSTVDFGAIASNVSKTFDVWNAYPYAVSINGIAVSGGEGISLTGLVVAQSLPPFSLTSATLAAAASGPSDLNTTYTFDFSSSDLRLLPVIGTRNKVWPFAPNWVNNIQVTYDYRTEIIVSRNRREQRNALRQSPRKRIQFEIMEVEKSLRSLNALISSWNGKLWLLAEETRSVAMSTTLAASATIVNVAAVPSWLVQGMTVILGRKEARSVASIVGNTITFTGSTATVWPIGTIINPGLSANINDRSSMQLHTDSVASMSFQFDVKPGSEIPDAPVAAPTTFGGRELFLKPHNWGEQVTLDFFHFTETVDFDRGVTEEFYPAPFNSRDWKIVFLNKSALEAEEFLQFFQRMKGQQKEFYRPTFNRDLIPKGIAAFGSKFLRFEGLEVMAYSTDMIHRAVYVQLPNGIKIPNTVKAITQITDFDGTDTQIEFDLAWPSIIDAASNPIISWMPVWRLASDTMIFTWATNTICDVQFAMRTLENLPSEN